MKILVDTHTHTIASDHAYSTVLENAAAAARAGLEALAVTDHTPPLTDAPRMSHFRNLRVLDRVIDGVTILRGAELNICDARGGLGVADSDLSDMDLCIASIHTVVYGSPDPAENLRAYQGAMEDARVKIIGHPEDGRAPVDFFALARAARDAGVLIEVNNSSLRPISYRQNTRENMTALLRACEACGAHICLGTDAHFAPAVGRFDESLSLLEELHFPEELVANTSLEKFLDFIRRRS
ncbi:MAG TPA: phosphatase [Candidatus Pullichristensenella stercoripullorum]|nr:phosphatase [Candidatus Pullichristensenella stercoripullorum]